MTITLAILRAANLARLPLFLNARGQPAHDKADGSDWTALEWAGAMMGEVGELCEALVACGSNVEEARQADVDMAAAMELADVICYADIVAMRFGVALVDADLDLFPDERRPSIALAHAVAHAGAIANLAKKYRRGDSEVDRYAVAASLGKLLGYLGAIARLVGFPPMAAVQTKFNQVSRRIGVPVIITLDGVRAGAA